MFESYEAMKYMKYFIFYDTVGVLLQTLLNFIMFDEIYYKRIFISLLFGCLISASVYLFCLKGKINKN